MRNLTREIAEFAASTKWTDVPAPAQEAVRRLVVDAVGCALLGHSVHDADSFETTVRTFAGDGEVTVIGSANSSAAAACLLNGYLITAATICDVHLATQCHVCPEVLPPAFAIAESTRVSGEELAVAIAVGLETAVRIGIGLGPQTMRKRGWHAPGIIGPLGGAVAGTRVLGGTVAEHVAALGIAGSQAAGTFAQWGTLTVKFHQSRGALSGLMAASLARDGFTSASDVLTSTDGGIFNTYAGGGDAAETQKGLGSRWELERISLRPWPVAAYLQGLAMALQPVLASAPHGAEPAQIVVQLSENSYALHGEMPWGSSFSARLSARYVAAVAVLDRALWLDQFSEQRVVDQVVDDLARRVKVSSDSTLPACGARVLVTWSNGATTTGEAVQTHGDPDTPISREELTAKFVRCGGALAPERVLASLAERWWHFDEEPDASVLIASLRNLQGLKEQGR